MTTKATERPADVGWTVVSDARRPDPPHLVRPRRIFLQMMALTLVALLLVAAAVAVLSLREAERESAVDATQRAVVLAGAVVGPSIGDDIASGSPSSTAVLHNAVEKYVLSDAVVRVKLWTAEGRIVYSDESRLVGFQAPLDADQQAVLAGTAPAQAELSDLTEPENVYEADQGRLLEVYTQVKTPDGQSLLFESYYRYGVTQGQVGETWRNLVFVAGAGVLALLLLLTPLVGRLLKLLGRLQQQREMLLVRAVEASGAERRRIAAGLHDGVVQDLAGTAFVLAGATGSARRAGREDLAADLGRAASAVRTSVGGLRALLVDIYPPSLSATGLAAVLVDLVEGPAGRGLTTTLELPEPMRSVLNRDHERLIFRVVQECLHNTARHARASSVVVSLVEQPNALVVTVSDDGQGFNPEEVLASPELHRYGVRLMSDAAAESGAELRVRSRPGEGTVWKLRIALP